MSELRKTPLYRALHRPSLIMGGDRKLMISALGIAAILVFWSMNMVGIVAGLLIAVVSVYALRKMGKADPLMWPVYCRQVRYKGYYAPFSRPSRVAKTSRVY